jgi:hypothetical protein
MQKNLRITEKNKIRGAFLIDKSKFPYVFCESIQKARRTLFFCLIFIVNSGTLTV